MGIKIPKEARSEDRILELNDIFVDREPQRHAFKRHLLDIQRTGINADGMVLIYSGVGGIGKTLLLNEFEKLSAAQRKKFVRYDFANGNNDLLTALKALRQKLAAEYQMEFPLFDKGCIYFAQKDGFVTSEQIKAVLKSSSLFRSFREKISSADTANDVTAGAATIGDTILNDDGGIWDSLEALAQDVLEVTPFVKFAKPLLNFIDEIIARNEESERKQGNDAYRKIAEELKARNQKDAAHVEEFLPTLFAQDLTFWLEKQNADLIVFLDTYEKLTGEEGGKTPLVRLRSENRDVPVDWWVGEILSADRVMWVIAGRYDLKKIGEINLKYCGHLENYSVDVFDRHWANKYLELLGVEEDDLRQKIIDVTGGHPFYLGKCFITYDNKRLEGEKPRPADFGESRDEVIARAVGTLNEAGQFMAQNLCILGKWTDELAAEVIVNFNNITYKRIRNLFARADLKLYNDTLYAFDRTIDAFFFPGLKSDVTCHKLFADIRDKAEAYFKKIFDENISGDRSKLYFGIWSDINVHMMDVAADMTRSEANFGDTGYDKAKIYFNLWSDIVLRTTDAPAELMTLYDKNFVPLERYFDYSTRTAVVKKFLDKAGDTEPLPHAYFQDRLGRIRLEQNRIKEALELSEAAYSAVKDLPLSNAERRFKIFIMGGLAYALLALERRTDEINLRGAMADECERYLPDDIDLIVAVKKDLAEALADGGRATDAIAVRRQIVELLDGRDFKQYTDAARELAQALEMIGDYESALPLRRKIVALYEEKRAGGTWLWIVLQELIYTLEKFSGKDYLEEKTARCRQRIALSKELGYDSSVTVEILAETLKQLGRHDEAAQVLDSLKDDAERRIEDLANQIDAADEFDAETAELALELIRLLTSEEKDAEATQRLDEFSSNVQAAVEQCTATPIEDYDAAVSTLESLVAVISDQRDDIDWDLYFELEGKPTVERLTRLTLVYCNEATINLRRGILALTEQNPDATVEKLIAAKKELADSLNGEYVLTDDANAEAERLFAELENYYRQNLPASREDLLDTLISHAAFMRAQSENIPAVVEKLKEVLALLESNSETPAADILKALQKVADVLKGAKNYSEELIWRERILNFCTAHFAEDAPEILEALEDLIVVCENLRDNAAAERYMRKLIDAKEKNLGASYIEVIASKEKLADILHDAGKLDDEFALREQVVELWRDNFSKDAANEKMYRVSFNRAMENLTGIPVKDESPALLKGQRIPLTKDNPSLDTLAVEFTWLAAADLEIDASAFLLGNDGKAHADEDFVFYGNTRHLSGAVTLDDGTLHVALKKIPDAVKKIAFVLTIYAAAVRKQNFGNVKIFVRMTDETTRKEIFHFNLSDGFTTETALVVGEIYRHNGEWKFNAVGAGFEGGLEALCENFGLEAD